MKNQRNLILALLSAMLFGGLAPVSAQAAETRVALVIGNANYPSGALATPANDAGLIAQTLQAAGFDDTVSGPAADTLAIKSLNVFRSES